MLRAHLLRRAPGAIALLTALLAVLAASAPRAQQPSSAIVDLQRAAAAHYQAGDPAGALLLAERALPLVIAQFGPEHEQTAIHYYSLGLLGEASGKLEAAADYLTRSVAIREKVYGPEAAGTAVALQRLGRLYIRMVRLEAAEPPLRRALRIHQQLTGAADAFTAPAVSDLARLSEARGDWPAALAGYRQAIRLIAGQDTSRTVLRAIAEEEIGRLRETFVGLGRAAWQLRAADAGLIAEAYSAAQLAGTTSAGLALAKMTARLGAGDSELGRAIRHLQDLNEHVLRLHTEDLQLLTDWSGVERADATYSAAADAFRAASIAADRDRAPAATRQRALISELEALPRCPPDRLTPTCAASASRRTAIARELAALGAASSTGSEGRAALFQRMQAAEQRLPGYQAFAARRTTLRGEIDRGEQEARAAHASIIGGFPRYEALAEPKPLSIGDTQHLLGEDEALIAILTGAENSIAWAVTRERADWALLDVGTAALEASVVRLRRGLDPLAQQDAEGAPGTHAGVIVGGFDMAAAHALYRQVLGPLEAAFASKRHLIIVPTGPLTSLPFQVLLTQAPPAADGASDAERLRAAAWLITRHALSVLPSVASLFALRTLPAATLPAQPFFGIGDPVLVGPDPGGQRGGAHPAASATFYRNGLADVRAVRALAPLPETAEELLAEARALGAPQAAVLLREQATESRLKATALDQYRVVAFATHGLIAGDLSGLAEPALVLTPPEQPSAMDDGLLTASEVATLKLNADWVVLSACNTAAGSRAGAEALSGLARAFFYAGARALLVSHWAVYSTAATELTTKTFAALAAAPGAGRAAALQQAMAALIAEGRPPGYWAPFVVVGEAGRGR